MSEQWTPERIAEVRELCSELMRFIDNDEPDPSISPVHREAYILRSYALRLRDELLIALDALESQRDELEAARAVIGRTRTMLSTMTIADENDIFNKHRVKKAIDTYDAQRSQHTGCYDPWGLERSE